MAQNNAEMLQKLRSLRNGEKVIAGSVFAEVVRVDEENLTVTVKAGKIERPFPISEIEKM